MAVTLQEYEGSKHGVGIMTRFILIPLAILLSLAGSNVVPNLGAQGVPSEAIFMDHAGFRTLDTMQRAAAVFGVKDAIVVTQDFHLARSLYLAAAAGIDAVGLVADKRKYVYADHYARREFLARVNAFLDVTLGRKAKILGDRIPITGDARLTHDATTQP